LKEEALDDTMRRARFGRGMDLSQDRLLNEWEWCLHTDVSGQPIDFISKVKKCSWTPSEVGRIGCPETLVRNYDSKLRNIPEQRR
jgi:predicted GNAT superfamily acetyltransferase